MHMSFDGENLIAFLVKLTNTCFKRMWSPINLSGNYCSSDKVYRMTSPGSGRNTFGSNVSREPLTMACY